MGFYRFMRSKHVDSVLGGEFRFGSLMYYRLLECVYEDEWIGDSEEGRVITAINNFYSKNGRQNIAERKWLDEMGVSVGNAEIYMNDCKFISEINGYILCFAVGERAELDMKMLNDEYNSCVSFPDVPFMAKLLYEHGVDSQGRPASHVFEYPHFDFVDYSSKKFVFGEMNGCQQVSPFVKRDKYKEQKEYRIFFQPKAYLDDDFIILKIGNVNGLVVEELRGGDVKAEASTTLVEPRSVYVRILQELYDGISSERDRKYRLARSLYGYDFSHDSSLMGDEVELFCREYRKSSLRAYWVLRTEYGLKCSRLDQSFSMTSYNGGDITLLLHALKKYLSSVG